MNSTTETRNPDEIERDIRNTQAELSRTVDQLGDQLSPRNLFNSLLDKADQNGVDARWVLDQAKRNPIALAMISVGSIWLVSDSDARLSTLTPSSSGEGTGGTRTGSSAFARFGRQHGNDYHSGYVEHMARCEPRPDEDELGYRRRRDQARASFLMIEQRHDEDEHGFRQRLDEATDRLRQGRDRAFESARSTGQRASAAGGSAVSAASRTYTENPLLGGLAAAFVGAIVGATLPLTRTEEEQLGQLGESALETAKSKAQQVGEQVRDKKDQLVEQADQKMNEAGAGAGGGSEASTQQPNRSGELSAV